MFLVYKDNRRLNMPSLDGKNGAPHPCQVSGERWTFAWITDPPTGTAEFIIIIDNFHQSPPCKSARIKQRMALLRKPWCGFQIYLRGTSALSPSITGPDGLEEINKLIITRLPSSTSYPVQVIRDDDPSARASCASIIALRRYCEEGFL